MADTAGEMVACDYCGTDIEVPADGSRYEASVAHFEAEHAERHQGPPEAGEATGVGARAGPSVEADGTEDKGISD
ncbi:hypothetical protein [Haloglomus litoreum]|uniref:hypothetical protein n=1 Tax=Haloglomus litoreum TaxID=3034026 RepID=UPI0023E8C34F|nr:hypothetical protein [Haloglomus sp. DT116]